MSEAAVLEAPPPTEAPVTNPTPARLVRTREEAISFLQTQLDKGAEIRALRIRTGAELDQARALKLDWTNRTIEILNDLFDTPAVAEECNDWVGRIYPEYAEFGNFVEQFFAEMDHRLKRLKSVVKRIERLPAAPRAAVATAPTPPVVDSAPIAPSAQAPMTQCLSGLLVLCRADEVSRELVAEFLESLDVDVSIVDGTEGIADSLDRAGDASFAVVLSGESQNDYGFELGFCAGRLGLKRVILVHAQASNTATDSRGFTHIALDPAGGWQLQLARHLKRAGLSVDLNRLC